MKIVCIVLLIQQFCLQVADILFIVVCVPFTATDYALTSAWPFGDTWCKLNQFLIVSTAFVSIYTLVLMALDRWAPYYRGSLSISKV